MPCMRRRRSRRRDKCTPPPSPSPPPPPTPITARKTTTDKRPCKKHTGAPEGAGRRTLPERMVMSRSAGSRWSASVDRAAWHENCSRGSSCRRAAARSSARAQSGNHGRRGERLCRRIRNVFARSPDVRLACAGLFYLAKAKAKAGARQPITRLGTRPALYPLNPK